MNEVVRRQTIDGEMQSAPGLISDRMIDQKIYGIFGQPLRIESTWKSRGALDNPEADLEEFPTLAVRPRGVTQTQIDQLRAVLEDSMKPASHTDLAKWIFELQTIAPAKRMSDQHEEIRDDAYGRRLRDYPVDVAKQALFGRTWAFFPSWDELKAECDKLVRRRDFLLRQVRTWTPWTANDEMAHLTNAIRGAQWEEKYFERRDPSRSAAAKRDVERYQAEIERLNGEAA